MEIGIIILGNIVKVVYIFRGREVVIKRFFGVILRLSEIR